MNSRLSLRWRVSLVVLAVVLAVSGRSAYAQVTSTFDLNLDGWRVTGDNNAAWEATTGNPDGCLSVNDLAIGALNYIIAPPKYHGDWSGMSISDTLSAQIYLLNTSGRAPITSFNIFRIAGPGGAAHALSGPTYYPGSDVWTTYSVPLDENEWVIETGTWADIISSVNSVRIMGEFVDGDEIVRLDNVSLSGTPSVVFVPCVSDDFNTAGTGDWSFQDTAGATNTGSKGNGGGYVKITDKGGVFSKALVPAMYLGNWLPLDNNGYVSIDLRILSRSGSDFGLMEFMRISGPGGSAFVTIDTADFPESSLIWTSFVYPINSLVWTVDAGTWSGLLANITDFTINLEFYDSTEIIGFDNFGRLSNNCPAIDNTVQVHDSNVDYCGWYSMVNISSIAYNSKDGLLYGLMRTAPSSAGGLYQITGPNPGIRLHTNDRPAHLIFDYDGNAFISENYDGQIFRVEPDGASSVWIGEFGGSADDDPYGMTFAPRGFNGPSVSEGNILVGDHGSNNADVIWAFSADTPEGEQIVSPDPGTVDYLDLAADPDGTVYVCDRLDQNNLYTLDSDGTMTPLLLDIPVSEIISLVYDSVEEDIYIASLVGPAVYRVDPSTGHVTLISDGFADLDICCLEIDPANRILWVADYGYNRVHTFCLDGGSAVDISVTLEGSARPNPDGWRVPLNINFFAPGDDVLNVMPLFHCYLTTAESGGFALGTVPGITAGTYDITAVSEHTLKNVKRNVQISHPGTAVNMGTLLEGNAENDTTINLTDFSILALTWPMNQGDPGFDSRADFDRNETIHILDFLLLCTNWLENSPIEVP